MTKQEQALAVVGDDERLNPEALLYAAIARAVADAQKVAKDAVNTFHKYKYASAEAVIEECRGHLSTHGLSLLPVSCVVDDKRSVLRTMYLLTHAMGGSLELGPFELSYLPGKGRPDDKAQLASRTELLGYANRDLLNLPRGDKSVSGRDDSDDNPPKKSKPPAKKPDRPAPTEASELTINEVKSRIKQHKNELGDAYCYFVVEADQIDSKDLHAVLTCLDAVRDNRLANISHYWAQAKRLNWSDSEASDDLRERFEVNDPTELTTEQLEEAQLSMRASIKERG